MGHVNFDNMIKICRFEVVRDLLRLVKPTDIVCT